MNTHTSNTALIAIQSLQPLSLEWLWPGYLPRGKLALLDGDPKVTLEPRQHAPDVVPAEVAVAAADGCAQALPVRLDEGVEILAQTPGKRLQPLTLLSGGERALTALAFLFALQAVNPSPFYVLDEVDAALDDANVMRFNRVLKRLSREQQFLIVTHNHSTMAQAEVLYGVTLGEHGISRIVSVRMEHDALMPVGERSA